MAAILYRGPDKWRVFDDAEIESARADGWYVLTAAGHVAPSPEPVTSPAEPARRKPGRPRTTPAQES